MPRKVSYLDNLQKERGQFGRAYKKTTEMSGKVGPGTDSAASRLRKKQDAQMGQLFGALLQGRRYSDKTAKQIKAKKK